MCVFFFFSSRRRHTRCGRDWSSDVCSSDLFRGEAEAVARLQHPNIVQIHEIGVQDSRSEEHTSELQSRPHLVCRLLLEKKKVRDVRPASDGRYFAFEIGRAE